MTADPVGTVLAAIGAGAATGAAVITAGAVLIRGFQGTRPEHVSQDMGVAVLGSTMFLGIMAAVVSGWVRARPIADRWRRGVAAALSLFGAVLLALAATPLDVLAGLPGIAAYLAVLLVAAGFLHALAHRVGVQ